MATAAPAPQLSAEGSVPARTRMTAAIAAGTATSSASGAMKTVFSTARTTVQGAVTVTSTRSLAGAIAFSQDRVHAAYDPEYAHRFWQVLLLTERVFTKFRTGFLGKCSPVHFFWGSFDLAVTRFSGRRAPPFAGAVPGLKPEVMREAYSHEVSSAGFWPGGNGTDFPAFYSYAYPVPAGFREAAVQPEAAYFSEALGEFLLPYDAVRTAADPEASLLAFLQSTYEAAARAADWDRAALECPRGLPCVPRAT